MFINQASSEEIGRSEVKLLAEQLDYKGEIAILSATANATNQNTWIKFMKDELGKPEYPKMKLVKVAYGDDDDQKSFQQTQGCCRRTRTSRASSRRPRSASPPRPATSPAPSTRARSR